MVEIIKHRTASILDKLPDLNKQRFMHTSLFGQMKMERLIRKNGKNNYIIAVWHAAGEKYQRLLFADKIIKADHGIKDLLGLEESDFKGDWFFLKIHEPESIFKNNRVILELLEGRRLNGTKLRIFKSDISKAARSLGLNFEFVGDKKPAEPIIKGTTTLPEPIKPLLISDRISRENIYDLLTIKREITIIFGSYYAEHGFRFCKDRECLPDLCSPYEFDIEVIPPGERNDTWYFILKPLQIIGEENILKIAEKLGEAIDADLNWEIKDIISRVPRNYENQLIIT